LALDPSFEFEKRRNEPVKYSREMWQKTIKAMRKVTEIKKRREKHYMMKRLWKGHEFEKQRDIKEVKRDINLIKSPAAGMLREKRYKNQRLVIEEPTRTMEVESDEEEEQPYESSDEEAEMVAEAN